MWCGPSLQGVGCPGCGRVFATLHLLTYWKWKSFQCYRWSLHSHISICWHQEVGSRLPYTCYCTFHLACPWLVWGMYVCLHAPHSTMCQLWSRPACHVYSCCLALTNKGGPQQVIECHRILSCLILHSTLAPPHSTAEVMNSHTYIHTYVHTYVCTYIHT